MIHSSYSQVLSTLTFRGVTSLVFSTWSALRELRVENHSCAFLVGFDERMRMGTWLCWYHSDSLLLLYVFFYMSFLICCFYAVDFSNCFSDSQICFLMFVPHKSIHLRQCGDSSRSRTRSLLVRELSKITSTNSHLFFTTTGLYDNKITQYSSLPLQLYFYNNITNYL